MIDPILNPSRCLSAWLVAGWLAALALVAPLHAQLVGFTMTGATTWSYDPADGGAVISGILKVPGGSGPFPAVLISHGKGGTAGGFSIQHANVLAAWGLVCIGPNYTHAGAAVNTPDNEGYCPENSRRARACLAILQSLGTVDMARVAAFGHSMGAFLTGGLLGEIPASFRAACISAGDTAVGYFQVTIQSSGSAAVNHRPDISWIADQRATPGAAIPPLAFTVTDAETAAAALTVTADSANPTLLPVANITLTSGSSSRTATLTPVSGQTGSSTVTLTVNDGTKTRATSFTVTVAAAVGGNTAPVIQGIANETILAGSTRGPIPLVIKDTESAEGNLTPSARSSNPTLVPVANIVFGGQNWGRTVTLTPVAGQAGRSVVTLST